MRIERAEISFHFGSLLNTLDNVVWFMKHCREARDDYEHQATHKARYGLNGLEVNCWAIAADNNYRKFKTHAQEIIDDTAKIYAA